MKADVWLQLALLITVAVLPPTSFKRLLEKLSLFRAQLALLSREVHRSWLSQWHSTLNCHALQNFVHRPVFFHLGSGKAYLVIWFTPARGPSPSFPLLFSSMKCCLQLPMLKPKQKRSVRKRRRGKEGKRWRFGGNLKAVLTWHGTEQCPARRSFPEVPKICVTNRTTTRCQDQGGDQPPVLDNDEIAPQILCSISKKILRHWSMSREGQQGWGRVWSITLMRSTAGSWVCSFWRKGGWGGPYHLLQLSERRLCWGGIGIGIFSQTDSNKTRRSGLNLHQRRFRLNIENNFLAKGLSSLQAGCPGKGLAGTLCWSDLWWQSIPAPGGV